MTTPNVRAGYTPPAEDVVRGEGVGTPPAGSEVGAGFTGGEVRGEVVGTRHAVSAGGEAGEGLHDLALALVFGCFDEVYSPVQRLTILTAIDIWTMALAASRDAALLDSLTHFWAHLQTRDYPSAYAEALIATRPTAFTAGVGAGYTPPAFPLSVDGEGDSNGDECPLREEGEG